jgi:transposase-like protein
MGTSRFSKEFKDAVITKIVNRGDQSIAEVCRQAGISLSAGRFWISERDRVPGMKNSRGSGQWTAEEKLDAILQSSRLSEEEIGLFLRKEGLHSHQLSRWRAEILTALGSICRKSNKDNSAQRIRELERDLNRKDKALAEASALLILQKKVNLIWGNKSEDEK